MKILSCGAGMQSTSLALISCEQTKGIVRYPQVPRYDAVIYCDLGIEPPWVIQQVRFIQQACESCDISFVILKSNLYRDYMDNFGRRRVAGGSAAHRRAAEGVAGERRADGIGGGGCPARLPRRAQADDGSQGPIRSVHGRAGCRGAGRRGRPQPAGQRDPHRGVERGLVRGGSAHGARHGARRHPIAVTAVQRGLRPLRPCFQQERVTVRRTLTVTLSCCVIIHEWKGVLRHL